MSIIRNNRPVGTRTTPPPDQDDDDAQPISIGGMLGLRLHTDPLGDGGPLGLLALGNPLSPGGFPGGLRPLGPLSDGPPLNVPLPDLPALSLTPHTQSAVFINGRDLLVDVYGATLTRAADGIVYRVTINGQVTDFRFNSDNRPPRWEMAGLVAATPPTNPPVRTWAAASDAFAWVTSTNAQVLAARAIFNTLGRELNQLGTPATANAIIEKIETYQSIRRFLEVHGVRQTDSAWQLDTGGRQIVIMRRPDGQGFDWLNVETSSAVPIINLTGAQPPAGNFPGARVPAPTSLLGQMVQLVNPASRPAALQRLERLEASIAALDIFGSELAPTSTHRIWALGGSNDYNGQIALNLSTGTLEYRVGRYGPFSPLPARTGTATTLPPFGSALEDETNAHQLNTFMVELIQNISQGHTAAISPQALRVAEWELQLLRASGFVPSTAPRFAGVPLFYARVGGGQFLVRPQVEGGRIRWSFTHFNAAPASPEEFASAPTGTNTSTWQPLAAYNPTTHANPLNTEHSLQLARVTHLITSLHQNEGSSVISGLDRIRTQTTRAHQFAESLHDFLRSGARVPPTFTLTSLNVPHEGTNIQIYRWHNGGQGNNARGCDFHQTSTSLWTWRDVWATPTNVVTTGGRFVRIGRAAPGSTGVWYNNSPLPAGFGPAMNDMARLLSRYNPPDTD